MPYFFFAWFFGGSFSISIASIDSRETGNLKQVYKSGNKRFWPHYSPHSFTMEQDQRAASLLLLGRWVATPLECAVPAEDCLPLRKSCTTHARTHKQSSFVQENRSAHPRACISASEEDRSVRRRELPAFSATEDLVCSVLSVKWPRVSVFKRYRMHRETHSMQCFLVSIKGLGRFHLRNAAFFGNSVLQFCFAHRGTLRIEKRRGVVASCLLLLELSALGVNTSRTHILTRVSK